MSPLLLTKEDTTPRVAGQKRIESVLEAISWPTSNDIDNKLGTVVYSNGDYSVRLSKPGKEAAEGYDRCKYKDGHIGNNPNDMRPEILYMGNRIEKNASFDDIFQEIEIIKSANNEGLELMGCLLSRSAFMADHIEIEQGIWRYSPEVMLMDRLSTYVPTMFDVPAEVFMHYLNALALNEDTKYYTLGHDITKDTGRKNNLLTYVNLIGVFLGDISFIKFASSFSMPPTGISAISMKKMWETFPELTTL